MITDCFASAYELYYYNKRLHYILRQCYFSEAVIALSTLRKIIELHKTLTVK